LALRADEGRDKLR